MEQTEVEGLVRVQPGVFANTKVDEYEAYIRRRDASNRKDQEISDLKETINILMERLNKIESK